MPDACPVVGVSGFTTAPAPAVVPLQYAPKELLTVMGVEGDPNNIPGALRLDEGRWPRRTDEIMLGAKLAREKELRVGDTVPVGAVVASRVTFVE